MENGLVQKENLNKLIDFYNNPEKNLCLLEAKTGYFKTSLIKESLKSFEDKFLIFKIKCFESTTLDDIFLSLFEDLKKYSQQKKVIFTKTDTNSISQKILRYLNHINLPSLIVIDSLQSIFAKSNQKDKEEILRFITHLHSMNKFKLVLASAQFPSNIEEIFEINDTAKKEKVEKIEMLPFTKEQTESCFAKDGINYSPEESERIFELTKGNPAYISITSNIITTLKTSMDNLLKEYETKRMSFEDFLLQKLTTFVPENVKKSLNILSLFNGGLSSNYLEKEDFFNKEQIAYMLEKGILNNEYGFIYLKSYLKKYLQKSMPNIEKNRIHTLWRDFYSSQLPLKPSERVILISRNTMRAQIEYHSSFIIEQKQKETDTPNLSLMSYLNSNLTAWNIKNTNADEDYEANETSKKRPEPPESLKSRFKTKSGLEKYELTKEELSLLGVPIDMRQKKEEIVKERLNRTFEQREEEKKLEEQKQKEKRISELTELAQSLEDVHNFETAASIYLQALNLNEDPQYEELKPNILEHLAFCCKKMNKTTEAIDFYNSLIDLYTQRNEQDRVNETRLEIAKIYKETYKINHARVIYNNFINKKSQAQDSVVMRSYIELAEIEEDLSNTDRAVEYYKKAFALSPNFEDDSKLTQIIAEAYFKYALILDDNNQTQAALDYYQKCIRLSNKSSIYLSSSFTNVGEILKESGNLTKAAEYYKKALKTDLELSNYEGICYICSKIANVYETLNPQQVLNWLLKSLSAAKRTKEKLYISHAGEELGHYYESIGEYEKAEKAYSLAEDKGTLSE